MNAANLIYRIREHVADARVFTPASKGVLSAAEERLGFPLPPLLRLLYSDVADGGFGPGHGFLPLFAPVAQPHEDSVVTLYEVFRGGDPEEPTWSWPERLLCVCDWGCAIRSCVDCSRPELPVVRFDPNEEGEFFPETPTFDGWLEDWLSGKDLW